VCTVCSLLQDSVLSMVFTPVMYFFVAGASIQTFNFRASLLLCARPRTAGLL
jgi:hypothetical protein